MTKREPDAKAKLLEDKEKRLEAVKKLKNGDESSLSECTGSADLSEESMAVRSALSHHSSEANLNSNVIDDF